MLRRAVVLVAAAGALTAAAGPQKKGSTKQVTRQVFVSVTDQAGKPVLDLGPGDFDITEAGVKRPVSRAVLGGSPMRIALLVDTSDGMNTALNHIRAGLIAFLEAVPPEAEVVLISTGRQMRVRVPPTKDRKKLTDAAAGLFMDGGGTVLIDGLLETDERFIKKAEDRWPVFVIITSDGTEGSAGAHEKEFNQWALTIGSRGASVHALVLKAKGSGLPEIVASTLTQNAGGRYDFMNTTNALPEKMKTLGLQLAADQNRMSTKYQIEFATDFAAAPPGLDIGVSRPGVKLHSSYQRE